MFSTVCVCVCVGGGGMLITVWAVQFYGDTMSTVGRYHQYCGGLQYHWGYHKYSVPWGGVLQYCGGYHLCNLSTMERYHDNIFCNLSTMEQYHDKCWIYYEYRGRCSVPWRHSNNKRLFPPMVLNIPRGTHDISPWY